MVHPLHALVASLSMEDTRAFFKAEAGVKRHRSDPVVDAAGHVVGMVSRSEVLRRSREGWQAGERWASDSTHPRFSVIRMAGSRSGQIAGLPMSAGCRSWSDLAAPGWPARPSQRPSGAGPCESTRARPCAADESLLPLSPQTSPRGQEFGDPAPAPTSPARAPARD